MDGHWSGVDVGGYFELDFEFDAMVYSQDMVSVPFQRSQPHGLSMCMRPDFDYSVKSAAGDSKYHILKALRPKVAPPLLGRLK